jgi:transposase
MENYRFCSPKDEREDIRTFPPCLRRLLQEKRRILQELKRRHEREFGKEKSALRKSGSLKRQYRLESNCRYPDETPKRVEDNRTGSQETFGRCLETFYHGL